eukprot:447317-Hanusia_phi.AAC.1
MSPARPVAAAWYGDHAVRCGPSGQIKSLSSPRGAPGPAAAPDADHGRGMRPQMPLSTRSGWAAHEVDSVK